jgi:hypothetical protein
MTPINARPIASRTPVSDGHKLRYRVSEVPVRELDQANPIEPGEYRRVRRRALLAGEHSFGNAHTAAWIGDIRDALDIFRDLQRNSNLISLSLYPVRFVQGCLLPQHDYRRTGFARGSL